MGLVTIAKSSIITGFSSRLIRKFVRYVPKPGEDRKLQPEKSEPCLQFSEKELLAFKKYLSLPWPLPSDSARPRIPSYIREDVKSECHYECAICGHMDNGEIAHIDPVSESLNNSPDNLILLCPNHHKKYDYGYEPSNVTQEVVRAAKIKKRESRRRTQLWESNMSEAFLAVAQEVKTLASEARRAQDDDLESVLRTHIYQSVKRLPELRGAAKEAAEADKQFEKAEALAAVELDGLTSDVGIEKQTDVISVGFELKNAWEELELAEYAGEPCPVCEGDGIHLGWTCDLCGGAGEVEKEFLRSEDLDLSQFEAVECPVCEGSGNHLGGPCEPCSGEGMVEAYAVEEDLIDPARYETVECPVCEGSGNHLGGPCEPCSGEGMVEAYAVEEDLIDPARYETVECPVCEGSGATAARPCSLCNGEGRIPAYIKQGL